MGTLNADPLRHRHMRLSADTRERLKTTARRIAVVRRALDDLPPPGSQLVFLHPPGEA